MSGEIRRDVLKREIIRLLKEDEDFRIMLIGTLASAFATREETNAILREIRNLRTDFNKRMEEMREDFNRRMEAFERRMEEMREDFNRRMEAFERRMEEMREDFNRRMEMFDTKLSALGARWGLINEASVRQALKGILERFFKAKVERWEVYDEKGLVYGHPSMIDVDVLIRDSEHILIEIKSHVRKGDVAELLRISQLYQEKTGVTPRLVIVSPYVDEKAKELAKIKNITIYTEKDLQT